MADMFPRSDRVLYDRTPLKSVSCEVRFPALLRIETEPPVAFQDGVRHAFPIYGKINTAVLGGLPPQILAAMGELSTGVSYSFATSDGSYSVKLASSSLALTSSHYVMWDEFIERLKLVLDCFSKVYIPTFYSRVGLRYQNAIKRSELGLKEKKWADLLRPELVGVLALGGWEEPDELISIVRSKLDSQDNCFRLQHGFGQIDNDPEIAYLLDFDFYTDKQIEVSDVLAKIDRLHSYSGDAFRWAIGEQLDGAMGPVPI